MNDTDRIVTEFCNAFGRLDPDELADYFAVDGIWHNIPLQPVVGRDSIHAHVEALRERVAAIRIEVLRQVSAGEVVMHERIDHIAYPDRSVSVPCAAIFELADGKITAWREYFDMGMLRGS